jgi:hypothetical protein
LTIRSGRRTPIAEIPTPDFAVPYAAPKQVKTIADVQPMAPKKGYIVSVSALPLGTVSSSAALGRGGCVIASRHRRGISIPHILGYKIIESASGFPGILKRGMH